MSIDSHAAMLCCRSTVAEGIQAGERETAENALSAALVVAFCLGLVVLALLQVGAYKSHAKHVLKLLECMSCVC